LKNLKHLLSVAWIAFSAGLAAVTPLGAEEKPKEGWSDIAEFSYVATSGNSNVSTLGFKNFLKRTWEKESFEIKAGAIRSESTITTYVVQPSGDIEEQTATTLAAENYYLNGRFDRKISDRFFWFAGAGWERNRPSGIDSHTSVAAGVGNIWKDTETLKFRTDYSATYHKETDLVEPPGFDGTFGGARLSSTYLQKFGASTTYGNDFIVDENLNKTEDYRGDMTNWVAVAMSAKLALKVSLQWLYRHDPAFTEASDPGNVTPGPDLVQLKKLDSIFTASLVVKF
jgi:hypothetical protein